MALSQHDVDDNVLKKAISLIFEQSKQTYGSPRIQKVLVNVDRKHSRKRIARLMAELGLEGRCMRVYRAIPGLKHFFRNIDKQKLEEATGINQVWVGDITYLKVGDQWRYLAVVMDWYSRQIIGWSLGRRRTVALTLKALNLAVHNRRPTEALIFHSDRGIEYVGNDFRKRMKKLGFVQSINRPSHMNDNARMESFFGSMKCEWLHGLAFDSDDQLKGKIKSYIPFYNYTRLHSSLDYQSPVTFEIGANN